HELPGGDRRAGGEGDRGAGGVADGLDAAQLYAADPRGTAEGEQAVRGIPGAHEPERPWPNWQVALGPVVDRDVEALRGGTRLPGGALWALAFGVACEARISLVPLLSLASRETLGARVSLLAAWARGQL